jgi:hypothetical protein
MREVFIKAIDFSESIAVLVLLNINDFFKCVNPF